MPKENAAEGKLGSVLYPIERDLEEGGEGAKAMMVRASIRAVPAWPAQTNALQGSLAQTRPHPTRPHPPPFAADIPPS